MITQLSLFANPLKPDEQWAVQHHHTSFIIIPKSKSLISNACTLTKTIQKVERVLRSINQDKCTATQAHLVVRNIILEYARQSAEMDDLSLLRRLIIKVVVFVNFGTTLCKAIDKLNRTAMAKHHCPNACAATLMYPKLMLDAHQAGADLPSYCAIADRYKNVTPDSEFPYDTYNKILLKLKNKGTEHWKAARQLIQSGKSIGDKETSAQCDIAMELFSTMASLSAKWEWEMIYSSATKPKPDDHRGANPQQIRAYLLKSQGYTAGWVFNHFSQYYKWLRSCPRYDKNFKQTLKDCYKDLEKFNYDESDRWISEIYIDPAKGKPFYTEGTSQHYWRQCWNDQLSLLKNKVDMDWCVKLDKRYYIDADTPAFLDRKKATAPLANSFYKNPFISDRYVAKQLFRKW